MDYKALSEGVRPGGITTTHQIIILLCYMVRGAGEPVTLEQLAKAVVKEELVNYFEVTSANGLLVEKGHLVETEEKGYYTLSPLGEKTVFEFENTLPAAVKDRAMESLLNILKLSRREEENNIDIVKTDDGYELSLVMKDIGSDLLTVKMFFPTIEQCWQVKKRILNDPLTVYKGIFSILTGDYKTFGKLTEKDSATDQAEKDTLEETNENL